MSERSRPPRGSWSFHVATVAGIPVRIHFTFLFLLAYMAFVGGGRTGNWLLYVGFVLLVFLCVVLHEFGHALTARKFGIETSDITLYPIGGVAMFEGRMKPIEELWIALAGPMVNVLIAAVLGGVLWAKGTPLLPTGDPFEHGILQPLFIANLVVAVFNLIPAFPMDGGRVLRGVLALLWPEAKATAIAASIGQILSVLLGLFAFSQGNMLLVLVAVFVFLGAGQEAAATQTRSFLDGHRVREAMMTSFVTIQHGATLQYAADLLIAGSQHDFPVMSGESLTGLLTRGDLARGLSVDGPDAYVAGHMRREPATVSPELPLNDAVELIAGASGTLLVVEEGSLVGLLTQENLSEYVMLLHAVGQNRR